MSTKATKSIFGQNFLVGIIAISLFVGGCGKKAPTPLEQSPVSGQLKHFIAEKKAQAMAAKASEKEEMLPEYRTIFAAAEKGDWETVSNNFQSLERLAEKYRQSASATTPGGFSLGRLLASLRKKIAAKGDEATMKQLHGTQCEDAKEIYGAFDCLASDADRDKYFVKLGKDIIHSIPPGSIYFGGTDSGRWTITALQTSHVNGDPFFTLTQNALADPTYLQYLEGMYGRKIYIPTANDSQKCFQDYMEDAQRRIMHDQASRGEPKQMKPGEDVKIDVSGHVQVSGQVAVMAINAELVKVIFDHETNREFYVEESFPLDWMYPYLEPHGLIMKINREPLADLPDEIIRTDHEFWAKQVAPVIGDWLKDDTSVQDICAFLEKVYFRHDFGGFKGDPRFVSDDWPEWMAKLRSAIAGVYMWRVGRNPSGAIVPAESIATGAAHDRMVKEADFAFREAFAICPGSPEVVFRYVQFLVDEKRTGDAAAVAELALAVHKGDSSQSQFQALLNNVKMVRNQELQGSPPSQFKP